MDKCNNYIKSFLFLDTEAADVNSATNISIKELVTQVTKKEKIILDGINFYETSNFTNKHFILDLRTSTMLSMSKQNFKSKLYGVGREANDYIVYNIKKKLVLVIRRKFRPQSKFGDFFKTFIGMIKTIYDKSQIAMGLVKKGEFWIIFLDFINMILNVREGYLTPMSIISTIISMYTLCQRFSKVFTAQIGESNSYETMSIFFSIIGVPESVSRILKEYTMITGKRLFSSSLVFDVLTSLHTVFRSVLDWLGANAGLSANVIQPVIIFLDFIFGNIICYNNIKEVVDLYTSYTSTPNIILQPVFRHSVSQLYDKLKENPMFNDYVSNHDNKFFREVWILFKDNLVKYVNTFTISAKEEPICIVFEGGPGSGKSVIMNSFVEVLRSQQKSVYVHSVPPVEGGKDFYDDYENQEVFVMDDIGQQGKSQWRTIINFVSPVKFPLECASANKKNTKFFNSKIILLTTNCFRDLSGFTSTDCIADRGALFRRCHVINVKRSNCDEFLQDLEYFKYDHVKSEKFESRFLHHNANINLPVKIVKKKKIEVLTYIRMLLDKIIVNENANRRTTAMTPLEILEISQDMQFEPQFDVFQGLSGYLKSLLPAWRDLYNGAPIFREWLAGLFKPCKQFMMLCAKYLLQFVTGVDTSHETTKIMRAKLPSHILGKPEEYAKNYRNLARKYHPDKYVENEFYTKQESLCVFLIITLAYKYYNKFDLFVEHRKELFSSTPLMQEMLNFGEDLGLQCRHFVLDKFYSLCAVLYTVYYTMDDDFVCLLYVMLVYFCIIFFVILFCKEEELSEDDFDKLVLLEKVRRFRKENMNEKVFYPQVACDVTISKYCKFVTISSDDHSDMCSHAIVSGNRILLNSHFTAKNIVLNIYATYDHFINNHPEAELVRISLIKDYPICDLAVYELQNFHSVYPSCLPLFRTKDVTPVMYLCTSMDKIPLIFDKNLFFNDVAVEYSAYAKSFSHLPDTGFITPIEGTGLCGSFIYNSVGDILGVHVAGDGKRGFCAMPSTVIAEDIRKEMLSVRNMQLGISVDVRKDFSGARLVYEEGAVETTYPTSRSTIKPTMLNVLNCPEMAEFTKTLDHSDDVVYTTVDKRGPPIINDPVNTIKKTSMKTFKNQGKVTTEELDFIGECIRSLMPTENFTDLSDDICAFGDSTFSVMNKESSNGYGHPKGKSAYFDFSNKVILPEFLEEFNNFIYRVEHDEYMLKDFLSKECFKMDELRNEDKREKPRTIRVLPVTHIWLTKKIFGKLAQHFKENKHETGIGLGFNPFKDFDLLYKKLSDKGIKVTGDLDAAKWDGSLVSLIMERIMDVMFEKYDGVYKFAKKFLISTIVRSFVLVCDELYMTTHGLPSGVWITFLLNSLFNRALDALVVKRNVPKPTVDAFLQIISYTTGDDKIFGAPENLSEYVNLITYRDVSLSLGMEATNGDKSPIIYPSQPLEKLTYLKRHMRFHPVLNRWVGPLSTNTIMNMTQWVDTTKDTHEALNGKIRSTQIEAYLHSPSFFRKITGVFESVLGSQYLFFTENQVINILNRDDGYEFTIGLRGGYNYHKC